MKEREKYETKETGGDIIIKSPFLSWLDNFWYHYKWTVIIVAFFVVTFLVCFVQCNGRQQADSYVTFAGPAQLSEEESMAVCRVLALFLEGETTVDMRTHTYFSEEDLRELYTDYYTLEELRAIYPNATDAELEEKQKEPKGFDNAGFNSAKQANLDRYNSLSTYTRTGECSLWLVSPAVYAQLGLKEPLGAPLSELFGENIPDAAYDACAVKLAELPIYQAYEALQVLPEDTLLVLTKPMIIGASSDTEQYARIKALFSAMVNFKPE